MVYLHPTATRASAPLIVPKPVPDRFRLTFDLRLVNKFTMVHQYPMPNLEHELSKASKSLYFDNFDLFNGYWQLPLAYESQECQSFVTLDGI